MEINIVNPNSPTGTSIKSESLTKILNAAKNSIVVLDEAYSFYARRSYVDFIKKFYNLIVVQTFSKAHGLAGLRLGYVVSAKENIENVGKVMGPFCVNSLAVIAGLAALEDQKHAEKILKR